MSIASKPCNETERIRALLDYHILDTFPEPDYDDIISLAVHICEVPIALISLVDQDRQWFKAKTGISAQETPREQSFCSHAILNPHQLMVVPNACEDERFKDNPLVTQSPHIRFYAGIPLVSPAGCAVGTLCVIDRVPRELTQDQQKSLRALGRQVMAQMELRRRISEKEKVEEALRTSESEARKLGLVASRTDNAVIITDAHGLTEWVNDGFCRVTGYQLDEVKGRKPGDFLQGPETSRETAGHMRRCVREGQNCQVEILNYAKDGRSYWVAIDIQPVRDESGALTNFIAVERDISQQKETEKALLESTTLQEAMLNAANYSIISTTVDGTIRTFNAAAEKMTGYKSSEVIGHMNVTAFHDSSELTSHAREISKELGHVLKPGFNSLTMKARMGVPDEKEWTCVRKDGNRIPIMLSLTALSDDRGAVQGFLGIANDITERRHSESGIKERQRFSSLTAAVGVALTHGSDLHDSLQSSADILTEHLSATQVRIWTVDSPGQTFILRASAGRFQAEDDKFMEVPLGTSLIGRIGLHREPCISHRMSEDPQFEAKDGAFCGDATAFAGWPLVVADKLVGVLVVWLEKPLTHYGEDALRALADTIALGITRKLTETALLETDERLRRQNATLIELANHLECAYENSQLVLESITEAAAHTLNVPRVSAWMFDNAHTLIKCSDLYELEANKHSSGAEIAAADFPAYFEALKTSNTITTDDANLDPRTREFSEPYLKPLGITSMLDVPIRSGGHIVGVLCYEHLGPPRHWTGEEESFARSLGDLLSLSIEMRQHERAESELAQARDRALEATRAKSEFLANMSHEIRTPMNGIIGMTNVLRKTELTENQSEMVETIRQSGDSLLTIINDILDFSKIEAGKLKFEFIDFDLRSTVEEVVELLTERATAKGLELALQVHHEVPCAVKGDPTRLRQVLVNLIGNAIKFTDRGEVVVDVSLDKISSTHQITRFSIKDTGIGIPAEAQSRLFESFSQADGSTTRNYGGTGLGLAICKRLVAMMHGEIGVVSQPDYGSQFWFTADFERQPQHTGDSLPSPRFQSLKALIVDDNLTNRKILDCQLRDWNIQPEEAASGAEALDKLREHANRNEPFNLVLLDQQMPGMDGLMLARAIRGEPEIARTRLVLLSSIRMLGDRQEIAELDLVLTKPVRELRLLQWLQDHFETEGSPAIVPPLIPQTVPIPVVQDLPANLEVLVVEDNEVNQRVALMNLHEIGLEADVVANGREALESLNHKHYDVVLMDCQMPVMDGYEATRVIRQRTDDLAKIKIIAMTASAMEGDRERCLKVGMDDYISKPIQIEELHRVLSGSPRLEHFEEPSQDMEHHGPVDMGILNRISRQKPDQVKELVTMYLNQTTSLMEELQAAIEKHAMDKVRYLAHQCAGGSASCGVLAMVGIMRELEALGRNENLDGADFLMERAQVAFKEVRDFFEEELHLSASPS